MPISGKQAIKVLREHGFELVRQKGSHAVLRKMESNRKRIAIVPVHKELRRGTLRSIARQADIDPRELGV